MSWMTWVVYAAVACWLLLTALAQFRWVAARISRFDNFRLVPTWTFFAPNPGVVDYHLVVRDRDSNGTASAWSGVEIAAERHPLNCFWNPQKRPKKVLLDAVQSLIIIAKANETAEFHELLSLPYL